MLIDAFWREIRASAAAEPKVKAAKPSAFDLEGMTYLRWNMVGASLAKFLARDMSHNKDPDGTIPSIPVWALHRTVLRNQFGQSRANAIRLQHLIPVYRELYEG